jgi:hypothetical protein
MQPLQPYQSGPSADSGTTPPKSDFPAREELAIQDWLPAPSLPIVNGEERRPVVYRAGRLPRGLPDWFTQLDTDGDAQIGLYEWKHSGRPLEEFRAMDRNNDGFVTVEEVLWYLAREKDRLAKLADRGEGSSPGTAGRE